MTHTKQIPKFTLFTGGDLLNAEHSKTADFVIYLNMAASNMEKMLHHYHGLNASGKPIKLSDFKGNNSPQLTNENYRLFADYLWKVHSNDKNKNDINIEEKEIEIVHALLYKLDEIRNYHAHIWHDNEVLAFDSKLENFVSEKHKIAMAAALEADKIATLQYEKVEQTSKSKFPLFKSHNGKHYITDEGKIFFLSFFLTTGQMSSFLQQRKGSKRTDQPLFKVKHIAYKHFCHRDGASILGFHQEDNILAQYSAEERKEILHARQAYKLISYLNDYPHYLADNESIPLLLPAPEANEKLKKVYTVQDLITFIRANGILSEFDFEPIIYLKENEIDNSKEEHEKNRTLAFTHHSIEGYLFHIGFDSLYKLVMLCLKYDEQSTVEKLLASMNKIADQRRLLYQYLSEDFTDLSSEAYSFFNDKSNQLLRGYRSLTELGVDFFENFLKEKKGVRKIADLLKERIRPTSVVGKHKPEPIIIFSQDFVEKTQQKFRAGNRFVYNAVKYLIDHNICPDWYWEVERFLPDKIKQFQQQIDEKNDWRLCIENDHVTVAIPISTNYTEATIDRAKNDMPQPMYQFSLGGRALRYLLAYHMLHKDINLNDFLSVAMRHDFDILTQQGISGSAHFKLLEPKFIPSYLLQSKDNVHQDVKNQIDKIEKRIKYITAEWEEKLACRLYLKRDEKNRIIMEAYKLFDWTIDTKGVKFLRKHEYQQLSVCHYTLTEKERKRGEKKSKFHYLYEDLFVIDKRKPPIPRQVLDIIDRSESLDDLLKNVVIECKKMLQEQMGLIKSLKGQQRKTLVISLCRKLGISVPGYLLTDVGKMELEVKRQKTLHVLPFAIHPMMVVKYFAPAAYRSEYINEPGVSRTDNNVFAVLRQEKYSSPLVASHYDTAFLEKIMIATDDEAVCQAFDKQKHKWIGAINTTHTEDALLWQIALQYLQENRYTQEIAKQLQSAQVRNAEKDNKLMVSNIHSTDIVLEFGYVKNRYNEDESVFPPVFVTVKMHQLDDVMYRTERERMRRAALHYLWRNSNKDEKQFWDTLPPYAVPEEQTEIAAQEGYVYSATSGTLTNPIPYHVLRNEMQLVAIHGKYLAGALLHWERGVIQEHTKNMSVEEKQIFMSEQVTKDKKYADFKVIIKLSNKLDDNSNLRLLTYNVATNNINDYRKFTFHSGIPITGTFSFWASPHKPEGKMLGITEPLHWPADRSVYKKQ